MSSILSTSFFFFFMGYSSLLLGQAPPVQALKGLTLIEPASPAFAENLAIFFPKVASTPSFNQIEPLSVIVLNTGTVSARAYSIIWSIRDSSGQVTASNRVVVKHAFSNQLPLTGRQIMIAPGEAQLVTPIFDWSSNSIRPHPDPNLLSSALGGFAGLPLFVSARSAASVQAGFDAVIGDDNIVMGPDILHLSSSYLAARNAEHNEGVKVIKLLNAEANSQQIVSTLQADIRQEFTPTQDVDKSAYSRAKAQEASLMLAIYQAKGSAALKTLALSLANVKRIFLTKQ